MLLQPYQPHELHFAYCYRVYLRWSTHRKRPYPPLCSLDSRILNELFAPHDIRLLESSADKTDVTTLISLQPSENISACASKIKGQVSKWLSARVELEGPTHLLSRGYYARTIGKTNRKEVELYLETQAIHHGYHKRILPPVFVQQYELCDVDKLRISVVHADVLCKFHIVLATRYRRRIFGSSEGLKLADEWRKLQEQFRFALIKVSFVPDHVHIAAQLHPTVSPADLVAELMNSGQATFKNLLVRLGLDRLWEPSAYLGSYGDLASPQISKYIQNLTSRS